MTADSQKMGTKVRSDGRRIDDHSFWAGEHSDGSVFPKGAKVKHEKSEEGAGSVMRYEDTTERIAHVQEEGKKQIRNRPLKPGYRY